MSKDEDHDAMEAGNRERAWQGGERKRKAARGAANREIRPSNERDVAMAMSRRVAGLEEPGEAPWEQSVPWRGNSAEGALEKTLGRVPQSRAAMDN